MTLLHRILFGGRETGLTFCYVQSMNLWKRKSCIWWSSCSINPLNHIVVIMLR